MKQAIGQCKGFLSQHFPKVTIERVASTAAAAHALFEDDPEDLHSVAICSAVCTTFMEDLEVLHRGIQEKQGESPVTRLRGEWRGLPEARQLYPILRPLTYPRSFATVYNEEASVAPRFSPTQPRYSSVATGPDR